MDYLLAAGAHDEGAGAEVDCFRLTLYPQLTCSNLSHKSFSFDALLMLYGFKILVLSVYDGKMRLLDFYHDVAVGEELHLLGLMHGIKYPTLFLLIAKQLINIEKQVVSYEIQEVTYHWKRNCVFAEVFFYCFY